MRGGGDGEAGGRRGGIFWLCSGLHLRPPRPCARHPPPAISIGLPGLHVGLHVAAAGSSSQQRWQPPRVSCFPARSGGSRAGRAAGGARGHRR